MPRRCPFLPLLAVIAACAEPDAPTEIVKPAFDHSPLHIVVNSLADPGVGACDAAECTLREALALVLPGGRINFSVRGTITLAAASGGLTVDRNVLIRGPAAPAIIVDGAGFRFPVFTINPGAVVTISRVTITGGRGFGGGGGGGGDGGGGGGVLNRGDLTLTNVAVTENGSDEDYPDFGTGIHNDGGTLRLRNSTVSANIGFDGAGISSFGGEVRIVNSSISMNVGRDGAGILNWGGELRLVGSTVAGNRGSAGGGGGVYVRGGSFFASNSTISGNRSSSGGGVGITSFAQVVLQSTTVTGNESDGSGGGIAIESGALDLDNTLVALNTLEEPAFFSGPDLSYTDGALTARFSLLGTADGHPLTDGPMGNLVGVSAAELNLGTLASNGGPTQTHALGDGSVAIDAGRSRRCPEVDQRAVARPSGSDCDIGSYEFQSTLSFDGFFPPILNPPDINPVTAGAVVKLQFRLKGAQGQKVLAPKSPLSQPIKCASRIPTGPAASTASENGVGLMYDPQADQYTYPWQTTQQWKGSCRQFVLRLVDGTTYRADFDFRP